MIMIRWIYKFIGLFETHASPQGIALGFSFGVLLALSPFSTLQFWCFLFLFFLVKASLASCLGSFAILSFFNLFTGPVFSKIGLSLLVPEPFLRFWTFMYNAPVIPYTEFYNPEVLGQLIVALAGSIPVYIVSFKLVSLLEPTIYHWWRTTKLYTLYRGYKPYAR